MKTLLYLKNNNVAAERLQQVVETLVPEKSREIHRSIESLKERFLRFPNSVKIAVLFAASIKDLLDLLSIRHFLTDTRIILILPDSESATVTIGLRLIPRFMSDADSNFEDVAAVLSKMLSL